MEKQPYPTASHNENSDSSILPSLSWWDPNLASKYFKSTAFRKRDTIPLGLLESSSVGLAASHGGKLHKYINHSAFSGMSQRWATGTIPTAVLAGHLGRAITWWGTQTPFFHRTVLITAPWPTPSTFRTVMRKETQIALACDVAPQSSYSLHSF